MPNTGNLPRMRQTCILLIALLGVSTPALAQVTVDLRALDALPSARPATPEKPHAAPSRAAPRRAGTAKQHAKGPETQEATKAPASVPPAETQPQPAPQPQAGPVTAAPTPPAATIPANPPAAVALSPVAPPQPSAEPPPAPPPISNAANSEAVASGKGLRVTFGAGQADLSPASAAAIRDLVKGLPNGDGTSFNVVAYAAGTPDDPSTARRLSLSRALAVRSALMADGISSAHIYVRALGASTGDETPDRVDVAVLGGNTSGSTPAQINDKGGHQ